MLTRRPSLRDSRGFTLTELVVAMALGTIVLLAAFAVIDRSFKANREVTDREDAVQRGRIALEQMTRQIRSMTCSGTTTPVSVAKDNEIDFYAYMGDPTNLGSPPDTTKLYPDLHQLIYTGTSPPSGLPANAIVERDYDVSNPSSLPPTVASSPYLTRTLITNVTQTVSGGVTLPVFSYWTFDLTAVQGTGALTQLSTANTPPGLVGTDLPKIVKVAINFVVRPTGVKTTDGHATTLQDDVFWRAVDPETPNAQPCSQGV